MGLPRSAREQRLRGIVDDRDPRDWMQLVEVEVLLKRQLPEELDTAASAVEDVGNGDDGPVHVEQQHGKAEVETDYGGDDEEDEYDETM